MSSNKSTEGAITKDQYRRLALAANEATLCPDTRRLLQGLMMELKVADADVDTSQAIAQSKYAPKEGS